MATSRGRLLAELRDAMRSADESVKLRVDEDNLYKWTAWIRGPTDTPYEHLRFQARLVQEGVFILSIHCPPNFPIAPPTVNFTTPVFHPNVNFQSGLMVLGQPFAPGPRSKPLSQKHQTSRRGEVCVDILKSCWSPAWTLTCLCHAIISLLADPNSESPLNCDAGNLLRCGDLRGFHSMARMYTIEFAVQHSGSSQ